MSDTLAHRYDPAAFEALFAKLEAEGFRVGPAGRGRALALLTELIAADEAPTDAVALAGWLAPVFVTRASEKARFEEIVAGWSERAARVEPAADAPPPKAERKIEWREEAKQRASEPPPMPKRSRAQQAAALASSLTRRFWAPALALVIVGALLAQPVTRSAIGQAWTWVMEQFQPESIERTAPPPAPTPTAPATQPIRQAPAAPVAEYVSDLDRIMADLRFRAAAFGYAPTLEELARPKEEILLRLRLEAARFPPAAPVPVPASLNIDLSTVRTNLLSADGATLVIQFNDAAGRVAAYEVATEAVTELGALGRLQDMKFGADGETLLIVRDTSPRTAATINVKADTKIELGAIDTYEVLGDILLANPDTETPTIVDLATGARVGETTFDAADLAAQLGIAVDLPLPLHREDVAERVLRALGGGENSADGSVTSPITPTASARTNTPPDSTRRPRALQRSSQFNPASSRAPAIPSSVRPSSFSLLFEVDLAAAQESLSAGATRARPARLVASSGAKIVTLSGHKDLVWSAAFSPDGSRIVTGSWDNSAKVWTANGALVATLAGTVRGAVYSAAFSPDGTRILTGNEDKTAKLWTTDGTLISTLAGHDDVVVSAAFSPDGSRIVTTSYDKTAKIWTANGELLATLAGHGNWVWTAAFNPDGTRLVTASKDETAKLWTIEGALIATLAGHEGEVNSAAFSPDGTRIVTASDDETAKLWTAEGAPLSTLSAHRNLVTSAAFSPDGAHIVTTSEDLTAKLWTANGRLLANLAGHEAWVRSAGFSPDGSRIVTASEDKTARIWKPLVLQKFDPWRSARRPLTTAELDRRTRKALSLPPDADPTPVAERVSAEDIARAWALYGWDTGTPVRLSDPPWSRDYDPTAPAPGLLTRLTTEAPYFTPHILALLATLLTLALWFAAALNARGFLARRKPDDPGRIADLAAEDRAKAERADQPLRLAARRMLDRARSITQLDLTATVDASARAGGFFTPITKPARRIPEYLFLIDMRSRADHDARRAMDYVKRLRDENVKVDVYFFERAPDRVREAPTAPLVPLETIVSTHATKRLVIIGDAAAMLSEGGRGVGAWGETIKTWNERAVLTTIPADEWGREEETLAAVLGVLVRPLSTASLSELPAHLRDDNGEGAIPVLDAHDLARHPLPASLRETPYRWLSEDPVEVRELADTLAALRVYLGAAGYRWMSACAVYPAIEYDLTIALGYRLKDAQGLSLATEARIATLSELPWMRAGQMPDWLRLRLIQDMDGADRQEVRAFIAALLEAARSPDRLKAKDTIALSFLVQGARGREAYQDDVFVNFLIGQENAKDPRTLEATKAVRDLLLPPLWRRLLGGHEVGILAGGLLLAAGAWFAAPRFDGAPLKTGALWALAALVLAPVLALWLRRAAPRAWDKVRAFVGDPLAVFRRERNPRNLDLATLRRHGTAWANATVFVVGMLGSAAALALMFPLLAWGASLQGFSLDSLLPSLRASMADAAFSRAVLAALAGVGVLGVLLSCLTQLGARAWVNKFAGRAGFVANAISARSVLIAGLLGVAITAIISLFLIGASSYSALIFGAGYVSLLALLRFPSILFAHRFQALRAMHGLPGQRPASVEIYLVGKGAGALARSLRENGITALSGWGGRVARLYTAFPLIGGRFRAPIVAVTDGRKVLWAERWGTTVLRPRGAVGDGDALFEIVRATLTACVVTLRGHKGAIGSAAFAADGQRIVTAGFDATAKLWDGRDGRLITTLNGHKGQLLGATFSPDGQRVVSASLDKTAKVWDATNGALLATLNGHGAPVYCAVFSPDGARIVTASSDDTAKIWDAQDGRLIATLKGHGGWVRSAAFSPDGARIVTASDDTTARVWDTEGQVLATFSAHGSAVYDAAFAPDGSRIVTASEDKTAKLWDVSGGALIATFKGHKGAVTSVEFAPDGERIVTGSDDKTAKMWNAVDGSLITTLSGHAKVVTSAAFAPDGLRIVTASSDSTAKVWDLRRALAAWNNPVWMTDFDVTLVAPAAKKQARK